MQYLQNLLVFGHLIMIRYRRLLLDFRRTLKKGLLFMIKFMISYLPMMYYCFHNHHLEQWSVVYSVCDLSFARYHRCYHPDLIVLDFAESKSLDAYLFFGFFGSMGINGDLVFNGYSLNYWLTVLCNEGCEADRSFSGFSRAVAKLDLM